jgi:hypothetical protein
VLASADGRKSEFMKMVTIEFTGETLVIHLNGVRLTGRRSLQIPLAHVVDASTVPPEIWEVLQVEHQSLSLSLSELRLEGGGPYGRILYYPKEPDRQTEGTLWGRTVHHEHRKARHAQVLTHSQRHALMITLTNEPDTLLILPVDDPAGTAAWIRVRLGQYRERR